MNRVLVKIFFPRIDKKYDVWIPLNKRVYTVINLLVKGINELNNDIYQSEDMPILYDRTTGKNYDVNSIIKNTNIKNGTELILM